MNTTFSNGFFKIALGVSALILSTALLLSSVNTAKADKTVVPPLPPNVPAGGKYGVHYVAGVDGENNFYWQLMYYNSETGKAKVFNFNRSSQKWEENFDSMPDHGL